MSGALGYDEISYLKKLNIFFAYHRLTIWKLTFLYLSYQMISRLTILDFVPHGY